MNGLFSARMRAVARSQAGFTLIEQLVAMVILVIIVGATLTAMDSMIRATPANQEWSHTVANTQAGIYRMTRELRQGVNVNLVSGYAISADIINGATTTHVLYQCDQSKSCTRKTTTAPTAAPSTGAGGATVMKSVENFSLEPKVPAFTSPSSKYYQVVIVVRSAGALTTKHTHNITLTDGFYARNS